MNYPAAVGEMRREMEEWSTQGQAEWRWRTIDGGAASMSRLKNRQASRWIGLD